MKNLIFIGFVSSMIFINASCVKDKNTTQTIKNGSVRVQLVRMYGPGLSLESDLVGWAYIGTNRKVMDSVQYNIDEQITTSDSNQARFKNVKPGKYFLQAYYNDGFNTYIKKDSFELLSDGVAWKKIKFVF